MESGPQVMRWGFLAVKGDFKLALAMREDPKALRVRAATQPAPTTANQATAHRPQNRRGLACTNSRCCCNPPTPAACAPLHSRWTPS